MENETELLDSQIELEGTDVETSTEDHGGSDTQSESNISEDIEALKQQNKELFARAKRAEGFVLENGQWVKKPKPSKTTTAEKETPKTNKSLKEQILENRALNDVHEDDVEEIAEYAERKGISLYEAKKSPFIQAFLKTRSEERASAQAASTGSARRTVKTQSDDALLENMNKNIVSDKDEDVEKLVQARIAAQRKAAGLNN